MGQNCCSQCNTKQSDQYTIECDEGTDTEQVQAIKAQLKFITTFSIPLILQQNQFKREFLKEINNSNINNNSNNNHNNYNNYSSNIKSKDKKINLYSMKVQSMANDPLGLYIEQQFGYEMNWLQLGSPVLSVNLITDWQKIQLVLQQKLSIDQSMLNIVFQEFHGNKFIHSTQDRIFNQFCSIQILQELLSSVDNVINNSLSLSTLNAGNDQNNGIINNNINLNGGQNQEQLLQTHLQSSVEEFIYIPLVNVRFKEYNLNGQNIEFIDCRRQQLVGYSNFEFMLKQTQLLHKCVNKMLSIQQNKMQGEAAPLQFSPSQLLISVIVISKKELPVANIQVIKGINVHIIKYLLEDQQALILRKRIQFQQDQLTFLIAESVQSHLSNQFLDEFLIDKSLYSNQNNVVSLLDRQVYNLRRVIHDHLNRIYIQSIKDLQKPEYFESYLINSLIYYFKRNQMQIFNILNNPAGSIDQDTFEKTMIVTKNNLLMPQDVINMNEFADFIFSQCSSVIFNEYFKKQYQEANLQEQEFQVIQQQNIIINVINKINAKLHRLKQNTNQHVRVESENFYTEGIQEKDLAKMNQNGKQIVNDDNFNSQNNFSGNNKQQNRDINQANKKQQISEKRKQKLEHKLNLYQNGSSENITSINSPLYQQKEIKYHYTPIQDTILQQTDQQIINSLPISPQNFHEKKESSFTTPRLQQLMLQHQHQQQQQQQQLIVFTSPTRVKSSQKQLENNSSNNTITTTINNKTVKNQQENKSNLRYKDDTYRESNEIIQNEQTNRTKTVNFAVQNSNNNNNNTNIVSNQSSQQFFKKVHGSENFENDGYDSPTFLSSKNINSSFNVIDQFDNNTQQMRPSQKQNQSKLNEVEPFQERMSATTKHMSNSMNYSKLDTNQKMTVYNKKLDSFLGCIFGSFLGDSMALYIRNKKQFTLKDIQFSMNMDYQPSMSQPNPGQLSEISEISLEIGIGLSKKQGMFDQKDIILNMLEWCNTRPPYYNNNGANTQEQKLFYRVLKNISSIQDDIKPDDLYRVLQQKSYKEQSTESNQLEVLARIPFLAIYTSAILDEDMAKIIKSQVNLFENPTDPFLVNSCLIFCFCIKQVISSNSDRKQAFEKTLQYCQNQLKDSSLTEILQYASNPIMKVFESATIAEQPLQFIVYLSFYFFYNHSTFESALQNVFSYGGGDSCLFGAIVGCLLGAVYGYGNLPKIQLQKMMNLNPENTKYFMRPDRYSAQNAYNVTKEILEFYFSKE